MNGGHDALITPTGSTIVSGGGGYGYPMPMYNGGGYGGSGFGAGLFGGIVGGALVGRGFGHDGQCCDNGFGHGVGFISNQLSDGFNSIQDNQLTGFLATLTNNQLQGLQNGHTAIALQIANEGRATDKSICDLGTNLTTQNIATNANINNLSRDTALGHAALAKDICETNHNIDKSTTATLMAIKESEQSILDKLCASEIQGLRDKLFEQNQATQTAMVENMLNERGLFPGSGPVITAHEACNKRDFDNNNLAFLLANQQASNIAINTGLLANAGLMGQGMAQGLGQGALQK